MPGLGVAASDADVGKTRDAANEIATKDFRMIAFYRLRLEINRFYFSSLRSKDQRSKASRFITSMLFTARTSAICARCSVAW